MSFQVRAAQVPVGSCEAAGGLRWRKTQPLAAPLNEALPADPAERATSSASRAPVTTRKDRRILVASVAAAILMGGGIARTVIPDLTLQLSTESVGLSVSATIVSTQIQQSSVPALREKRRGGRGRARRDFGA